jgi:hypothetical protein
MNFSSLATLALLSLSPSLVAGENVVGRGLERSLDDAVATEERMGYVLYKRTLSDTKEGKLTRQQCQAHKKSKLYLLIIELSIFLYVISPGGKVIRSKKGSSPGRILSPTAKASKKDQAPVSRARRTKDSPVASPTTGKKTNKSKQTKLLGGVKRQEPGVRPNER